MSFSWRSFANVAEIVGPIALQAAGVPAQYTTLVIHGIQIAEDASNGDPKTGQEKKAIALDAIQTGLSAVNAAKPGTVDINQLTDVVSNGIDEVVAAVNAAKNIPVKVSPTDPV